MTRYIITPDTTYDSDLWHVVDTERIHPGGEPWCVLTYAQKVIAEECCRQENQKEQEAKARAQGEEG